MSRISKPRLGHASSSTAQPQRTEEDKEVGDIVQFQASLDASVASVRSMVSSWIPKNLPAKWHVEIDAPSFELRPPGLGLGASASVAHAEIAAQTKLRNQLMPSQKKRALNGAMARDAADAIASGSGSHSLSRSTGGRNGYANGNSKTINGVEESDSDDEEESRSRAIKPSMKLAVLPGVTRKKQKTHVQALLPSFPSSSSSSAATSTSTSALLSTSIEIPSASAFTSHRLTSIPSLSSSELPASVSSSGPPVVAQSFYGTSSKIKPLPTPAHVQSLSDLSLQVTNGRRKGRSESEREIDQVRKPNLKRTIALSLEKAASPSEGKANDDSDSVRDESGTVDSDHDFGDSPFRALSSADEGLAGAGVRLPLRILDDVDSDDGSEVQDGDRISAAAMNGGGVLEKVKKKKKRNKKKKKSAVVDAASQNVLQLHPRD